MKLRHSNKDAVTIADELMYQEAVSEVIDAYIAFEKVPHGTAEAEKATAYVAAEIAGTNAWNALTATIDAYVARRISETLEKL